MDLHLLTESSTLGLYQDVENEWLYLDWRGDLTLPIVREGCMTVSKYFLQGNYSKVLNDNTNIMSLTADVSPWLATEFLPYIVVGGIKYIAWVYAPNLNTQHYTHIALSGLKAPIVALFSDVATAYGWLKTARFRPPSSSVAEDLYAEKVVQMLKDRQDIIPLVSTLENRLFTPNT